jgi:hypothetical protein
MTAREGSTKRILLTAAAVAYVASLFLPGILTSSQALHGIYILWNGWMGPLVGEFAWYANPLFLLAAWLILRDRVNPARICAFLSLALGLTSFFAKEWWFNEGSGTPIQSLDLGFYVWLLSLTLMAMASLFRTRVIT